MGLTGIWRADPSPLTRRQSVVTSPILTAQSLGWRPVGTVVTALAMSAVLAFPREFNPPLLQPAQTSPSDVASTSAPPPIVTAQPPNTVWSYSAAVLTVQAWATPPVSPLLLAPPDSAALIVVVTTQPSPLDAATAPIGAWPAPWWTANAPVDVAPWAAIVYGDQPAPAAPLTTQKLALLVAQWPPAWTPANEAPTLGTGIVAGPSGPALTPGEIAQLVGAWPAPWWPIAPNAPDAAIAVPLVVSQPAPLAAAQAPIAAWPALTWPANGAADGAPWLTLTYGDQPPRVGTMPPLPQLLIAAQWPPAWWNANAPSIVGSTAGTIIPVVPPLAPANATLPIAAWPAPWWNANPDVEVAPWAALTYGQTPAPSGAVGVALRGAGAQHPALWTAAQAAAPTAAIIPIPPSTVLAPPAMIALLAPLMQWPPAWWPANPECEIQPLTLVYGATPTPASVLAAARETARAQSPAAWWPASSAAPSAGWNVVQPPPITPLAVMLQTLVAVLQSPAAWYPAQAHALQAAWDVKPPSPHTAPGPYPWVALWLRAMMEGPRWPAQWIKQPGGAWIQSIVPPPPPVIVAALGKYRPEHDGALATMDAITPGSFAGDWATALAATNLAPGSFAADWLAALQALRDAGV